MVAVVVNAFVNLIVGVVVVVDDVVVVVGGGGGGCGDG